MGSLIRMLRPRFDLAYWVTLIASPVGGVLAVRRLLVDFLKICASAYDILMKHDVTVWYHPFPVSDVLPQLITFSDAGYNTLPGCSSVESFMIVRGVPVDRDGAVRCKTHPISRSTRKMRRVARSSLAAEAAASSSAIDYSYWMRAVIHEVTFGGCGYRRFNHSRITPLRSPFSTPRDSEECERVHLISSRATSKIGSSDGRIFISAVDSHGSNSDWMAGEAMRSVYESHFHWIPRRALITNVAFRC